MTTALQQINTRAAAAPTASYSQGIAFGPSLVTAGQVGRDPVTGELPTAFGQQVQQALKNLVAVLAAAGLDTSSVVKTTCFLSDIANFAEFDAIYRRFFVPPLPARSTVGVALADGLQFEIEAWATTTSEEPT